MKRTLFVGDVHGCFDELILLMEKVKLTPEDYLYFCGDLINKWPKSREVIEWIRARPNTWSVAGNHEYFTMISQEQCEKEVMTQELSRWLSCSWVPERLAEIRDTLLDHRNWLLSLPFFIEKDEFLLIHWGLHPEMGKDAPPGIAMMIRMYEGRPWYEYYEGSKKVIYGHWAMDGVRIRPNTIGLDSGCCFGWHLSVYCLETGEIWQQRANQVYKTPRHWKKLEWPEEV